MSEQTIISVLESHSVAYRLFAGRLQAADVYSVPSRPRFGALRVGRKWIDVGGMNRCQLFAWLGY